ncbi:Unknown protein [Striga hermonthica]|uniref:Reverse transcriptase zinc-binding domain-containing protein n=1 Tax=Striga hermonthica TaxID=68872 RepID=A0A9N7RHP7_STRHE|nr:Unknown protein [Striga hermonthica]
MLPATILLCIAATLPPSPDLGHDIMYWGCSGDDRFTTSSAYNSLTRPQLENSGRIWKDVWSWSGPQRIRQFMWLVAKGRLLTNDERYRHHLAESATCVLCGAARETILHCLRDCRHANQTWRRLLPTYHHTSFFSLEVTDWLRHNIQNQLHVSSGKLVMYLRSHVMEHLARKKFIYLRKHRAEYSGTGDGN